MSESSNNNLLERIDRYLQDEMSSEEKAQFEQELANDPYLREEVAIERRLRFALENLEEDQLRHELRESNKTLNQIRASTPIDFENHATATKHGKLFKLISNNKKYLSLAGILLMAVICTYFLLYQQKSSDYLFTQYYEKPPNTIAVDTRHGANANNELKTLMLNYEKGHYQSTLIKADQYLEDHPEKSQVRFYRGIVHLELGQHHQAIEDLKTALENANTYRDRSLWFLALAYLAKDQQDKAKQTLKSLNQRPPSNYQEKGAQLLTDLE